jgi:hypothetical protein
MNYGTDGVWAVNYGPVTLAAETDFAKPHKALDAKKPIAGQLTRGEGLQFFHQTETGSRITFRTFYDYKKGEFYYLYIQMYDYNIFD